MKTITMLPNDALEPIFLATVQAVEEAAINAMIAVETMTGINDRKVLGHSSRSTAGGAEEIQPSDRARRAQRP